MTRSGFVALAGRPNVGKSTLLNALAGRKLAIVSERAQTTRRAIRCSLRRDDAEIVLVDLPGMQRPRDALTARMAARVSSELADSDAALLVANAEQGIGRGERFIAGTLAAARKPLVIAVNKIDRVACAALAPTLAAAGELAAEADVFAISARTGAGLETLVEHLAGLMPQGPFMFPEGTRADQPRELMLAELVREALIRRTFQELPHASEVVIEEIERRRADLVAVRALIWVESESQKRIVVGARGRMVKAIGIAARRELERELGSQVHLELSVRVRRDWRRDESLLDRLGIR